MPAGSTAILLVLHVVVGLVVVGGLTLAARGGLPRRTGAAVVGA